MEAHAVVPTKGGYKKFVKNVWTRREACKRLNRNDIVRAGDRQWGVLIQMSLAEVEACGGPDSPRLRAQMEALTRKALPAWNLVNPEYAGKRLGDLQVLVTIGRPRTDWEFVETAS
jgi:hypothetical protein